MTGNEQAHVAGLGFETGVERCLAGDQHIALSDDRGVEKRAAAAAGDRDAGNRRVRVAG